LINHNLEENFEFLNDRPLYANISGGKDSTALGLYLLENKIRFTPVFLDTGWEHPSTYEYIKNILTPIFGEFTVLRNEKYFKDNEEWKGGFEQMLLYNKVFPNGMMKFCTRELKITPVMNFYVEAFLKTGKKPINCLGIRAEESFKRSTLNEKEEKDEATIWRPLIQYKEADVIDLHHKHNVPPNPLYLKGYSRVGCYPCIYARKHEIRHIYLSDPDRIEYIAKLEEKVTALRENKGLQTFFKSKSKDKKKMTINEIVEWSNTSKGQVLDDQEDIEEDGCMRWGLCETLPNQDKHKQMSLFK
jgi:3'-phosphoadenosine 5'-phosphosulfate sulfotransferase (PAPS reductase)/FAD synthetase